jgi:4-hydroxybenzoate polyprenyltransferase
MKPKIPDKAIAVPSAGVHETIGRFARLAASVRWREVLVLQGTPLFGALFSIGKLTGDKVATLALLLAASCCVVAHVFVFNDWSGVDGDLRDPHRATSVFVNQGVRRSEIGYLSTALMALGLLLLVPLGVRSLGLGAGVLILSALYSAPGLHFKGIPLVNSVLHFGGGVLHFLLGYALFSAIDARGLEVGAFFALTFVAGHLTHEARDWEGDRLNDIVTNAVRFGRRACFLASFVLFTVAYALLAGLALRGIIPHLIVLIAAIYPLQLGWTIRTLRAGLNFESLSRMQARYRAFFMIIGAIIVVALLPSLER